MNRDAWLEALAEATKPIEGFTTAELCILCGKSESVTRARLRKAIANGRVVHAGFRTSNGIDGREVKLPIYRFVKK
jgi:hypothetical protein